MTETLTPDDEPTRTNPGWNPWGLFMIALGGWWLLGELGLVPFTWGIVAPLALIAVGVSMAVGRRC